MSGWNLELEHAARQASKKRVEEMLALVSLSHVARVIRVSFPAA